MQKKMNVHPSRCRITPAAARVLEGAGVAPRTLVTRHLSGDWGEVDDPEVNDAALEAGDRTLGSYKIGEVEVWVIADAVVDPDYMKELGEGHKFTTGERYALTVLLPEDY